MKKLKIGVLVSLLLLTAVYFVSNRKYLNMILEVMKQRKAQMKKALMRSSATDVVFLKTYKTGGTTLQNILYRKAHKENLTLGAPKNGDTMFVNFFGNKFSRKLLIPRPKVNMLLGQMIFNYKEVSAVMGPETSYIALLREPGKQFESAFNYLYDRVPAFKKATGKRPLLDYLKNAKKYQGGIKDPSGIWWQGKNGIFYEFGYDNLNETEEYIKSAIAEIDKIFDFVLILEYFDMSLLLLKDLLGWEIKDILYLEMNVRDITTVEKLDTNTTNLIYDWNKADVALYKHFNDTFWNRIEAYGKKRMTKNLSRFQKMRQQYESFCVGVVTSFNKTLNASNKKDRTVYRYVLRDVAKQNDVCVGMVTEEREWFNKILAEQYAL